MKRVEFFIGTDEERDGGEIVPFARETRLNRTRDIVAQRFGGATLYEGQGAWVNAAVDGWENAA